MQIIQIIQITDYTDHTDHTDHTYHTGHTDHTDHTNRGSIWPEYLDHATVVMGIGSGKKFGTAIMWVRVF